MHLFQDLLRLLERELISSRSRSRSHSHGISVLVDTCPKKMSYDQGAAFAWATEISHDFTAFQLFFTNSLR